ncbi:MAG: chemotaxis protein CheW, partial [Thermotogae bacterium]|nr:chemotaxis protein CheW [Thermotogota bacterium]
GGDGSLIEKANETTSKENSTFQMRSAVKNILSDAIPDSVLKVSKLAIKEGFQVHKIVVNLVKDAVMKSSRIYVIFKRIESDGSQIIFSEPSVEEIEKENFDKTVKLFLITKKSISEIQDMISNVSEVESVSVENFDPDGSQMPDVSPSVKISSNSSAIKALLIGIGKQTYAISLSDVDRLIYVKPENVKVIGNVKVVVIKNEIIPLMDMREYFGEIGNSDAGASVMIIEYKSMKYGLIVDEFIRQDEIALKTLGKMFEKAKAFRGGSILSNGAVALVIDIPSLVENFSQNLK